MKKLILIAVATLVVLGAGVLSVRHYNQYKTKQTHDSQVAAQKEAEAKKAADDYVTRLTDQLTKTRQECEKGLASYAKLPAVQQKAVPVPNCGPAVVQ